MEVISKEDLREELQRWLSNKEALLLHQKDTDPDISKSPVSLLTREILREELNSLVNVDIHKQTSMFAGRILEQIGDLREELQKQLVPASWTSVRSNFPSPSFASVSAPTGTPTTLHPHSSVLAALNAPGLVAGSASNGSSTGNAANTDLPRFPPQNSASLSSHGSAQTGDMRPSRSHITPRAASLPPLDHMLKTTSEDGFNFTKSARLNNSFDCLAAEAFAAVAQAKAEAEQPTFTSFRTRTAASAIQESRTLKKKRVEARSKSRERERIEGLTASEAEVKLARVMPDPGAAAAATAAAVVVPGSRTPGTPSPSKAISIIAGDQDPTGGLPNSVSEQSVGAHLVSAGTMPFKEVRRASTNMTICSEESIETAVSGKWWRQLVEHSSFDYGVGVMIMLNALVIGAQTQWNSAHVGSEVPDYFNRMDIVFCIFFTLELFARLTAYQMRFFFMPGKWWNILDLVLVALQVFENVVELTTKTGSVQTNGFSAMRMLRILRVIRIIRLVRMLRLIGELRTIVVCIAGSLRSLVWTVALLLLVVYITAVYMTHVVSDARAEGSIHEDDNDALLQYYGSLFRSVLTLYEAISGGLSWDVAVSPLIVDIHPLIGVVFSFYIAFVLLAIMNVVTGVFVESAMQTAKREEDDYMVNNVRELFNMSDRNANGIIDWTEFESQLDSPHMEETFKLIDADAGQARELFLLLDVEQQGKIHFDDFIHGFMKLKGPARAIDLMVVLYEHRRFRREFLTSMNGLAASLESIRLHMVEIDEMALQRSLLTASMSDTVASLQ